MTVGNGLRIGCLLIAVTLSISQAAARTLQQVRNTGELKVAVTLASPWAMRDRDGTFIGYEIDVARALSADLGAEPRFMVYEPGELVKAVEFGEADIVIAGLPVTAQSALHVNFSTPHTTGGLALATQIETTRDVKSLIDLDSADYSLAVVQASAAATLAERLLTRIEVRAFANAQEAAAALVDGTVDAYLEEDPVPHMLALEHPGSIDVPLARALLERRAGFAVAKGDADFLAFLNAWIVAREDDTWLSSTHRYWFRSLQWRDRLGNAR